MPANVFTITISAVDKATAVANRVNRSIGRITSPAQNVVKAVGQFSKATGLEKVGKDLLGVGNIARDAASRVASLVPPLTAIASVGGMIAALNFTKNWALGGAQLQRDANVLGITTTRLQTLQGAFGFFGVEARELSMTLKGLGDTTEDALFGRNQETLMLMNRLGIHIQRTKNGAIDLNDELGQIADAVQRQSSPESQRLVARMFGVENLLPLLQKGRRGIEQYQEAARKAGAIASPALIAAQSRLAQSIIFADLTMKGLTNTIEGKLLPIIQPAIEKSIAWVSANRDLIATNVGRFIEGVGAAAAVAGRTINWIVNLFGGWQVAGIALAASLAGRMVASTVLFGINVAKDIWYIGKAIAVTTIWAVESLPALATNLGVVAEALGLEGVSGAFLTLGAAIEATPVGWIMTGLVAIGAAAYGTYKLIRQLREEHDRLNDNMPHRDIARSDANIYKIASFASSMPFVGPIAMGYAAMAKMNLAKQKQSRKAAELRGLSFFESKGWSPAQAAGIVANLNRESGMDAGAVGDNGTAIGLAQWHPERAANFFKRYGYSIQNADEKTQFDFTNYELTKGSERRAGDALRQARDAESAGAIVSEMYERPRDHDSEAARRGADAKALLDSTAITVDFKNVPPGARVTTTKPGKNPPAVKVSYAMPWSPV